MELFSLALFALMAALTHLFAYSKGYFRFPYGLGKSEALVSTKLLLISFAFYFLATLLIGPYVAKYVLKLINAADPEVTTLSKFVVCALQAGLMLSIFLVLVILARRVFPQIWKEKHQSSAGFDYFLGVSTWMLGFPLVTVISDVCDWVLNRFFGVQYYEQAAVSFLKEAITAPKTLVLALFAVMVLAPLIEEILFRGLLQNYLKNKIGAKAAILLTAFTFSLFHLSGKQGLGNISLGISLFILGIYLGFLYERQRSLLAPLGLHMSFNTISALRILIAPEAT